MVAVILAGDSEADRAEALAVALTDREAALECFRALAAERAEKSRAEPNGDDRMRGCRQCANLVPSGRCLAAWRGVSFGPGIAVSRQFVPLEPDRPQRCDAYLARPDGADRPAG